MLARLGGMGGIVNDARGYDDGVPKRAVVHKGPIRDREPKTCSGKVLPAFGSIFRVHHVKAQTDERLGQIFVGAGEIHGHFFFRAGNIDP